MTTLPAPAAQGVRLPWEQTPAAVREFVDAALGAPVVQAANAAGGFSPGVAARVTTADGTVAFVKAAGTVLNPHTPALHRREREVLAALPADFPAPGLIAAYDDGDWVALICEYLAGENPRLPWEAAELAVVLSGLERLAAQGTPAPVPGLETLAVGMGADFDGWRRLAGGTHDPSCGPLDAWSRAHLDGLAALASNWEEAAAGTTLLHCDLRADNILIDGAVPTFVDWAWASAGAPWVDLVALLPSVAMQGGPPPEEVFAAHPVSRGTDRDGVDAVVAAVAGNFTYNSILPPPPGLPTLRAFQAAQGAVAREWLATRTGWR